MLSSKVAKVDPDKSCSSMLRGVRVAFTAVVQHGWTDSRSD